MNIERILRDYGKETIEHVYETGSGCLWLIGRRKISHGIAMREGLTRISDVKWETIDLDEIQKDNENMRGKYRPVPLFEDLLPCQLSELLDEWKTPLRSYFE